MACFICFIGGFSSFFPSLEFVVVFSYDLLMVIFPDDFMVTNVSHFGNIPSGRTELQKWTIRCLFMKRHKE